VLAPSSLEPNQQTQWMTWGGFGMSAVLVLAACVHCIYLVWKVAYESAGDVPQQVPSFSTKGSSPDDVVAQAFGVGPTACTGDRGR